jgi:hypothetical protein
MGPNGRFVDLARRSWWSADDDVSRWRRTQLLRAGFDDGMAARLAGDCGVDLHALIELVEAGCPPELAARILAPLDDESRPC